MNQSDGTAEAAIDTAVMNWRAGVRDLEGRELDELTDHVASSARTLMENNLAADEAVLIAARRLGAERELVREFERGDGRARWSDARGLLLLGAALALVAKPLLSVPAQIASMLFGSAPGWHTETLWIPTLATALATLAALLVVVRARSAGTLLERIRRNPRSTAALASAALIAPTALNWFNMWTFERKFVGQTIHGLSHVWSSTIASSVVYVGLPIALLAIAHRRLRNPLLE